MYYATVQLRSSTYVRIKLWCWRQKWRLELKILKPGFIEAIDELGIE